MLKWMRIRNFQSHKDTKIRFEPGVNVIVGPSDKGKSVIVKALEWVRTNSPGNIESILNWNDPAGKVLVRVGTDRGVVERLRGKGTGTFKVNDELFSKFGSRVPESVAGVLGLGENNVQSQLDRHFLILDPPGEVSRKLNRITKLENLDIALAELRRRKTDRQQNIEDLTGSVEKLTSLLSQENLEVLEKAKDARFWIDIQRSRIKRLTQKQMEVRRAVDRFTSLMKDFSFTDRLDEKLSKLQVVGDLIQDSKGLRRKYVSVNAVVAAMNTTVVQLDQVTEQISVAKGLLSSIRRQLISCPYCGSTLTEAARKRLLEGNNG